MMDVTNGTSNAEQQQELVEPLPNHLLTLNRVQQNCQLLCNPFTQPTDHLININNLQPTFALTDTSSIDASSNRKKYSPDASYQPPQPLHSMPATCP